MRAEILAAEAVHVMEEHKVNQLLVVDERGALLGALNMHDLFRAKVIDVAHDSLTIECTGKADKVQALLHVLEPFGVRELVQSGIVGVGRGPRSITDRSLRTA